MKAVGDIDAAAHAVVRRAPVLLVGEGLPGFRGFFCRHLDTCDPDLCDTQDAINVLDVSFHASEKRSVWVGILRLASAVASVPIIQPPTAPTIWSSVAACSTSGSTL